MDQARNHDSIIQLFHNCFLRTEIKVVWRWPENGQGSLPYLFCKTLLASILTVWEKKRQTNSKNGACRSGLLRVHHNLGRSRIRKLRSPGLFIPSSSFLWCLKNSSLYSGNNHFSFSPLCVWATCAQIALRRTYQLPNGAGFALGLHILLLLQLWSRRRIQRKNKMRLLESWDALR